MSNYYKSLNDCSQKNWYIQTSNSQDVYNKNLVGYYSDCGTIMGSLKCDKDFVNIGYIQHSISSDEFYPSDNSPAAEATNGNCRGNPHFDCDWTGNRQICRRNKPFKSTIGNGWTECCNSNPKLTVGGPNDCHPLLYYDNKLQKPSQNCVDICMQNPDKYKNIPGGKTTTLKNDYLSGACHDILIKNKDESKLREFCSKSPAWSNSTGPNASYSKICGCYYPDSYYENLKKIISDKTKIPEDMLGPNKCMSSFCADSKLNDNTNCPNLDI